MTSEYKTDKQITEDAPLMAVTYCNYDYGEDMSGCYLNCERQFFSDDRKWVDMDLVDNFFHSPRRLDDIRNNLHLTAKIEALEKELEELRKENEWISFDDRLPEEDGVYQIYVKALYGGHLKEHCVLFSKDRGRFDISYTVTHWKPITPPNK